MNAATWPVCTAAVLLIGACKSLEPDYPVVAGEYDEGLIGTWVARPIGAAKEEAPLRPDGSGGGRLVISPRVVWALAGRLNPEEPVFARPGEAVKELTQYRLLLEGLTDADAPLRLNAYVVRCGDRRLLGVQVSPEALTDANLLPGLVLPVHWFFDLRREGDTLTLTPPEHTVLWMPWVTWAHAPGEFPPIRPERLDGGAFAVTTSIDAAIEYYERAPRLNLKEEWRFERLRE